MAKEQTALRRRAATAGRRYKRLQAELEEAKAELIEAIVAASDEGGITRRALVEVTGQSRARIQQLYNVGKGRPENGVRRTPKR